MSPQTEGKRERVESLLENLMDNAYWWGAHGEADDGSTWGFGVENKAKAHENSAKEARAELMALLEEGVATVDMNELIRLVRRHQCGSLIDAEGLLTAISEFIGVTLLHPTEGANDGP